MILLDTNIVVAYFNGDEQIVSKVVDKINKIALPALVIAELDYWRQGITKQHTQSGKAKPVY